MTSIKDLQKLAFRQSADKGFHDDDVIIDYLRDSGHPEWAEVAVNWRNGNRIALQHSELSEALEELRNGTPVDHTYYAGEWDTNDDGSPAKPEGVPSEMADVVIRVLDFCGANGIDLEHMITEKLAYNASRAHKHGGKKF